MPSLILCVVTRPLVNSKESHAIRDIIEAATLTHTLMALKPLDDIPRLTYAAKIISKISGKDVGVLFFLC